MKTIFTSICCLCFLPAVAQKTWNVAEAPGNYNEVTFEVNEGTWMNLDISPDGKTIVFDLLGDIYSLPVSGGQATLLRGGLPFEVQPRFSPDGRHVLFTSDAGGGDNIWTMDPNGSNAKQVTQEDFRLLNNATWAPDGNYFVARKHFTSGRSLGAGELWMYHTSGGSGIQLTKRKNDQQDVNEPSFSPDGKFIYYSEDMYPGGYFQYNKDPNNQIYGIKRYNMATGTTEQVITGSGGACRPQVSPDGKKLAFVKRVRTKTVLYVHDLETGEEWPLYDSLSKDQQEAWAIFGVYTGYSWTPDNKQIVIWSHGKILSIEVATLAVKEIPFTVKANHRIHEALRFRQEVSPEKFDAKMIRHARTSPDGKILVFSAVGYLWKKQLPDGIPQRITSQTEHFEFEPAFSPAGNELLYVTWNDSLTGTIRRMSLSSGKSTVLSTKKGIYRTPSYSVDGKSIVYWKERGNDHQGFLFGKDAGIYTMDISGKNLRMITEKGATPVFSADGKNIFLAQGNDYISVDLNGQNEQVLVKSVYGKNYVPSPDNKWIAFTDLHKVYVAAFPVTGKTLELTAGGKNVPVAQFARDAGIGLHWSAKSDMLCWTLGDQYYTKALRERFLFLENADSLRALDTAGITIGLQLKTDVPETAVLLKGARIITVNATNEVIENGDLLVVRNKIMAIGKTGTLSMPAGTRIVDVKGKTIMPGLVDVHAHLWTFREGIHPQQFWPYYAHLAYGVTTTHDPSSNSEMTFTQSEMVKYGTMVGPRIFSTGTILYGAEGDFKAVVNQPEDARSAVFRTQAAGAFSVKSYNQPRREQRQQIIEAASKMGVMVVPEGGSFFYHNMSMILDGHTGIEHNIPVAPVYNDVIRLWGSSRSGYTPTLIVCYGAVSGENYWYQKTNVWEKQPLMTFTPRSVVDARARHRVMIPDEEYENGHMLVSRSCKKLADAGVKINLGSHGQLEGLGAHWELWMLAQGGMSPMEVLRAGTINGAEYIGMGDQIGSLDTGKLADLVILDQNPLENIYNTESIRYVMVNGRMYDAATMNETGGKKNRQPFWFENLKQNQRFDWNDETGTFTTPKCHCGRH